MNLEMYKIIFWDFDGVIKESISVKSEAFEELFKPYGKIISKKIRSHHIENAGVSRFDKIPLYLEWSGIEPTNIRVKEKCSEFSRIVKNKVIQSAWVPGVESFLRKNNDKFIFIIVSATPEEELIDICRSLNIDNLFAKIYGSPTTKSNAIMSIIQDKCISSKKCLMIGDALTDIKAAKDNNVNFIFRRHLYNQDLIIDSKYQVIHDFNNFI